MWVPIKLGLKDFMGHIDSSLTFVGGRAYMVYGVNQVDEGQKSNGSGKSAILEAICIALIGDPLRSDVTAKDLVRRGQKSFRIDLELYNTVTKNTLIVDRTVFSNTKAAILNLTENGKPLEDIIGVSDGKATIFTKLGISKDDLINYFLISKEKYKGGFFKLSDDKKKEMIGRFSQSNLIDPVFDKIQAEINQITNSINPFENSNIQLNAKKELLQSQINDVDSVDELKNRRDVRLNEIKKGQLQSKYNLQYNNWCISQIEQNQYELFDYITELQSKIDANDVNSQIEAKNEIVKILEEIESENKEANKLKIKYANLLLGTITCPKCSHEFITGNGSENVVDLRCKHNQVIEILDEAESEADQCKIQLDQVNKIIKENQIANDKILNEIRIVNSSVSQLNDLIVRLNNNNRMINDTFEDNVVQIKRINDFVIEDKTIKLISDIKQIDVEIEQNQIKIDDFKESLIIKNKMFADFIKFRTHLSNTAIGVIEAQCNEYLDRMGSDLKLIIEGYKINKSNKQVVEKITPSIKRGGIDIKFGTLSSGEKARIDVGIILSLQKLINANIKNNGGLDLCFLDEIIESVDSLGMEGLMKNLDSLQQTIIVVTHGTFDRVYENTIVVTKTHQLGSQIQYKTDIEDE